MQARHLIISLVIAILFSALVSTVFAHKHHHHHHKRHEHYHKGHRNYGHCQSQSQCRPDFVCRHGKCIKSKGESAQRCFPLTDCGLRCVDTSIDVNNCGKCGIKCAKNSACIEGSCTPPEPPIPTPEDEPECPIHTTRCSQECVDTDYDELHCGGCGSRCQGDEDCLEGRCTKAGGNKDKWFWEDWWWLWV